jgi:hypothetical protein
MYLVRSRVFLVIYAILVGISCHFWYDDIDTNQVMGPDSHNLQIYLLYVHRVVHLIDFQFCYFCGHDYFLSNIFIKVIYRRMRLVPVIHL